MQPRATRPGPISEGCLSMNGDAATLPTLSALLAERARTAPDRPAILAPGRQALSYGALYQLAQEQHQVLRERGIGHADRVAVVLPDGYDTAACAMTVAANAVCVPINPTLRGLELRALFRRLQPSAVVASPGSPAAGAAAEVGASLFRLAGRGEPAGRLTAASGLVSNRLASARPRSDRRRRTSRSCWRPRGPRRDRSSFR